MSVTLQWFEKPLSIKQQEGLPERIKGFLAKCPKDAQPDNAKALLLALLDYTENTSSEEAHKAEIEQRQAEIERLGDSIKSLDSKLGEKSKETEEYQAKTTSLQQETEGLRTENERLKSSETTYNQFYNGLLDWIKEVAVKAPYLIKDKDESPIATANRLVYVLLDLQKEVNLGKETLESLQKALTAAETKPFVPKVNQAIIDFTTEERKNLLMAKTIMEKMGHQFETTEPDEVIHAVITAHLELIKLFVGMSRDFAPLINFLK